MWDGSGKTRNRRFVSRTDRYSLGVSSSTREQLVCEHSQRKRSGVSAPSTDELATVASVWRRSLRRRNRSSFSAARVSRCDASSSRRPPRSEGEYLRFDALRPVSDPDAIASRCPRRRVTLQRRSRRRGTSRAHRGWRARRPLRRPRHPPSRREAPRRDGQRPRRRGRTPARRSPASRGRPGRQRGRRP